jgi:hypothetical protein
MINRHLKLVALLLAMALGTVTASAQSTQFSLGLGYNWLSLTGSEDMYKSQFNARQGFGLQELSLATTNPSDTVIDHLRFDAAGFGSDPEGRFRLRVGLAKVYDLQISYFRARYFNALPTIANPFFGQGITPGQHTQDQVLYNFDMNLELLPGASVTPLIGYSEYHVGGPSITTYHVGQDEFRLNSNLDSTTHETRAGLGFHLGDFQATVIESWRTFHETTNSALAPGAGASNNPDPVLGQNQTLSSASRSDRTDGSYAMTTGSFSAVLSDSTRASGSFVRADYTATFSEGEAFSGNLVSFDVARFFTGLNVSGYSTAHTSNAPDWRGDGRVEFDPTDTVQLSGGFVRSHRTVDGFALISNLYTGSVNYAGLDPRDLAVLLTSNNAMQRDDNTLDAKIVVRKLGPVRLWADVAHTDQDLTVAEDVAEIVVPGGQGGYFHRSIKRYSAGAALTFSTFKLGVDWKEDSSPQSIVRIDFRDVKRWKARADWTAAKLFRLVATAEWITGDNPTPDVYYDLKTKHIGADLDITPVKPLALRLGYGRFKTDTSAFYRVPQDFTLASSLYGENGIQKEASATLKLARFLIDGGYSKFSNTGSVGLELDHTYAHCDFDFTAKLGASLQYDRYKYIDDVFTLSSFDAKRYGVFLRWRQ